MSSSKPEKEKQSEKAPQTNKTIRSKDLDKSHNLGKGKKKADSRRKSTISTDDNLDQTDVDELVICALCKHDMCSPKHLPCLHTFCETCITKHIEHGKSQSTNMHVVCPTCEHHISVPRASDDTKSFSESLPVNTLVSSLLSKKDLAQKRCKRCKLHGRDTKADNWCAYCAQTLCDEHLEYHISLTSGRHPVYDIDKVIRNPDIGFAAKKCRFHDKEDIKLFCNDHWNVCCNLCSKRLHGMCNTCMIEYDTSTIKTHGEVITLKRKLDAMASHTEKLQQDIHSNMEVINKQVAQEKENIKEFRAEINKRLDDLESQLTNELDAVHTEKIKELEKEAKMVDMKHKTALMYKTMLSVVLKDASNIQALTTLSDIRQNTHRLEDELRLDKYKLQKIGIQVTLSHETFKHMFKIGSVASKYTRLRNSQSPSRQLSTMTKMSPPRLGTSVKFQISPRISQ